MKNVPSSVTEFLRGKRFAVAGVSRTTSEAANAIFRKLRDSGYEVVPINPRAGELEGVKCYADLASIPGNIDGVVVVTHPDAASEVVRQAAARGIRHVWFHRSFGTGSVSPAAIQACKKCGIEPIVGGCPLMYCEPVDFGHRCIRWWLGLQHRIP